MTVASPREPLSVKIFPLDLQPKANAYWLLRPATERIAEVGVIRREFHGWTDESEPRLERVCRILERA